jgi:hypothetical protein
MLRSRTIAPVAAVKCVAMCVILLAIAVAASEASTSACSDPSTSSQHSLTLSSVDLLEELADEEVINFGPLRRGGITAWLAGHLKLESKGSSRGRYLLRHNIQ